MEINRIQYASDLHLEFIENKEVIKENPLISNAVIFIVAEKVKYRMR